MISRKTATERVQKLWRVVTAVFLLSLASCVSQYNAQSHKDLTNLKAYHIKFLDTFKAGSGTGFSSEKVQQWSQDGDLQFRQAEAFSASLKDASRTQNFIWLHEGFTEDANLVLHSRKPLSEAFASELKKERESQYDLAVKGEKVRPDAPQ
jgi:hypothetical protein